MKPFHHFPGWGLWEPEVLALFYHSGALGTMEPLTLFSCSSTTPGKHPSACELLSVGDRVSFLCILTLVDTLGAQYTVGAE